MKGMLIIRQDNAAIVNLYGSFGVEYHCHCVGADEKCAAILIDQVKFVK